MLANILIACSLITFSASQKSFKVPIQKTVLKEPFTPVQKKISEARQTIEYHSFFADKGQHLLSSSDTNVDLLNQSNLAYSGPVYFGTPMQEPSTSKFIYDTGSGYLTVTGVDCSTCSSGYRYYDPSSSTSATGAESSTQQLKYGSATLKGYLMTDNVCLDPDQSDTCSDPFQFFYITSESGLDNLDGILGLSPDVTSNGPSFMGTLMNQNKIDDPVASFHLGLNPAQSEVMIGGIDSSAYSGSINYHSIEVTNWWTLSLDGVQMGNEDIQASKTRYAIIDTGTSFLYLSQSDYLNFVTQLQNVDSSINCSTDYCESNQNQCSHYIGLIPDLIIQLGNRKYTIPVEGFTLEAGIFGTQCIFAVSSLPDSQNMYILGDTFIRNFYSVFNYRSNQVGLAVSVNAPSGTSISNPILSIWTITAIVLCSLLFVIIIIVCICKCRNNRKLKKQTYHNDVLATRFVMTPSSENSKTTTPTNQLYSMDPQS